MTLDNRVQTEYGAKKQSKSKFVIVATHGAKDDLMTAEIAEEIAKIMSAGFVVNTRYKRIECDLNNIKDIELNSRKNRFYRDIDEIAEDAKQYSAKEHDGCEHAVIVHIHGMKNRGDHGIDIGIGAKWNKKKKKYQGAKYHPEAVDFETGKRCGGKVRANIEMTAKMRRKIDGELKTEKGKRAWIGKYFAAWKQERGIQYHAGTDHHAMQIEICESLRNEPRYIASKIAEALQEAYEKM